MEEQRGLRNMLNEFITQVCFMNQTDKYLLSTYYVPSTFEVWG